MRSSVKNTRGFTLLETTIVIAITAILASAFVALLLPSVNFLLYFPQSSRVNKAAADLVKIVMEGDEKARGLRFAGPACKIGGGGGGGSGITEASTAGGVSTLTYNYADNDYCGGTAPALSHTVTLAYDSSVGTVTRSIDGGPAHYIPYYVDGNSDIRFQVPGGGADLFHYFGSDGTDLGTDPLAAVPIVYVKSVGGNSSKVANTSLAVTVPAGGIAAGHFLVVSFAIDGVAGTVSATDTQGNTYNLVANVQYATPGTGNVRTVVFSSLLGTALNAGNTITVTYPSRTAKAMSVDEFTGVSGLDTVISATGAGTSVSTGNLTTDNADSLLFSAFGVEGDIVQTFTANDGFFASPPTEYGTTGSTAATNITINPAYKVVNSKSTYASTATLSVSTDCARALAAFTNVGIGRVDMDVIAIQGSGRVSEGVGQIRLKSGVQIKKYKGA